MQSKKVLLIGSYSPENEGKPEIIDRDYYRQGWIFKDEDAFQNRQTMFAIFRNCRTKSIRGTTY